MELTNVNKQINDTLDNISILTNRLLNQSMETNEILTIQNEQLIKMESSVNIANDKIIVANENIDKILSDKKISFINGLSTGTIIGSITFGTMALGFGSLPIVGISIIIAGTTIIGTFIFNKITNKYL